VRGGEDYAELMYNSLPEAKERGGGAGRSRKRYKEDQEPAYKEYKRLKLTHPPLSMSF
jgi:hypothetical protein